jgi:glycosyltransferase involved in cell wall biosynthesis
MINENSLISVVIPNYNGRATIGPCLQAVFASTYRPLEVVVVDDGSTDGSTEIIAAFDCRLIRLELNQGVSRARNVGGRAAAGDILFFTDADCLLTPTALATAVNAIRGRSRDIVGGTYTPRAYDRNFFSDFQARLINHLETRRQPPDYVAAHALVMTREIFLASGGFLEGALIGRQAGVEDVEFSHRLRRAGYALRMHAGIQVRHIFNFNLQRSLSNAFRKARLWTMYALSNGDLLADSGFASRAFKINVVAAYGMLVCLLLFAGSLHPLFLTLLSGGLIVNLLCQRTILAVFLKPAVTPFGIRACLYYLLVYSLAAGGGALCGLLEYGWRVRRSQGAWP